MYLSIRQIRQILAMEIDEHHDQGFDTAGCAERLASLPDSYDALLAYADGLGSLPMRGDWPYDEPDALAAILAAGGGDTIDEPIRELPLEEAKSRVHAGFLGSVCGCVLGKPVECKPTLAELRGALEATGDWPLNDYISQATLDALGRSHWSKATTERSRIRTVACDDDINYTLFGAMILFQKGVDFTQEDVRKFWFQNLAPGWTWGPERNILLKSANIAVGDAADLGSNGPISRMTNVLNPGSELCGAQIRADAYGYVCPGRPRLAAELAFRDASFTHRRTGVYGTMFTAAAIAAIMCVDDPFEAFHIALKVVPRRSRFGVIAADCLAIVSFADDWLDAYEQIHTKYQEHGHCQVYQETGTLMNSLRFATSVGDGICKQVMQGNDTDSYAATAGSLLGCYFGHAHAGSLDDRWLAPFNNTIHTTLAEFHEQNLSKVADWIAELPSLTRE